MPIRKLNASECELAGSHLPKPAARRVCRRSCVEWRTNDWSEVNYRNITQISFELTARINSMCLFFFLMGICVLIEINIVKLDLKLEHICMHDLVSGDDLFFISIACARTRLQIHTYTHVPDGLYTSWSFPWISYIYIFIFFLCHFFFYQSDFDDKNTKDECAFHHNLSLFDVSKHAYVHDCHNIQKKAQQP